MNDIKDLLIYSDEKQNTLETNENIHTNRISSKNLESKSEHKNLTIKNEKNMNEKLSYVDTEIMKHNMTIMKEEAEIIFQYYWKIENILDILSEDQLVESGDFHFSGKIFNQNFNFFLINFF